MVQLVRADELIFGAGGGGEARVGESQEWNQQPWHLGAGRGAGVGDQERQTVKTATRGK